MMQRTAIDYYYKFHLSISLKVKRKTIYFYFYVSETFSSSSSFLFIRRTPVMCFIFLPHEIKITFAFVFFCIDQMRVIKRLQSKWVNEDRVICINFHAQFMQIRCLLLSISSLLFIMIRTVSFF
jgi:hypothetical protein